MISSSSLFNILLILYTLLHVIDYGHCDDPPEKDKGNGTSDSSPDTESPPAPGTDLQEYQEGDVPVLQYDIDLELERNLVEDFNYESVHSRVSQSYEDIPDMKEATTFKQQGLTKCEAPLEIKFLNYRNNRSSVMCLYRDVKWGVEVEGVVEIGGQATNMSDLASEVNPIKGFVLGEPNSVVKGYLLNGNFFGHVRIFDEEKGYHVHFYIEPADNLKLYSSGDEVKDPPAILFEYIAHEDRDSSAGSASEQKNESDVKRRVSEGKPITKREAPLDPITLDEYNEEKVIAYKSRRNNYVSEDNTDDIYDTLPLETSEASGKMFDLTSLSSYQCPLCIWIQPNFADKFDLGGTLTYGVAEVINIVETADWIVRTWDYNGDMYAENFGLNIKSIVLSDQILVKPSRRRKKRSSKKSSKQKYSMNDLDVNDIAEDWGDGHYRAKKRADAGTHSHVENPPHVKSGSQSLVSKDEKKDEEKDEKKDRKKDGKKKKYSTDVETLIPKDAYKSVLEQMKKLNNLNNGCCAKIAFIYHNLGSVVSVSTVRGLCSDTNLVLVSGVLNDRKLGTYDLLRGLLHGLGHLLGAKHEKSAKFLCNMGKPTKFVNPLLMEPYLQLNVGLRPHSMRLSDCTKAMAMYFLMSRAVRTDCFDTDEIPYCGNGIAEVGEECDCGAAWQCEEDVCCGERETVFGCKNLQVGRQMRCRRPQNW